MSLSVNKYIFYTIRNRKVQMRTCLEKTSVKGCKSHNVGATRRNKIDASLTNGAIILGKKIINSFIQYLKL